MPTLSELNQIEQELNIILPKHYKEVLLNYPYHIFANLPHGGAVFPYQELLSFAKNKSSNKYEYGIIDINKEELAGNEENGIKNKLIIGYWDAHRFYIDLKNPENTTIYEISPEDYQDNFDEATHFWNWDELVVANSILEFIDFRIKYMYSDETTLEDIEKMEKRIKETYLKNIENSN